MLEMPEAWIVHLILVDMDDVKNFSKNQGALEADDLNHWDINFWSERLRESKFDINEVNLYCVCTMYACVRILVHF